MARELVFPERIMSRIQELIREARRFDRLPAAQTMALRLERIPISQGRAAIASLDRPVCILLLGGTGVGKSELFNALLGQGELSPTSATIRPKTVHAHVAVAPADRQFLGFLDDAEIIVSESRLFGLVLIDAPDVDSVETGHLERTRRLVERADIVVYVGSPDKRANFSVHREIRRWAARKRWFFVLNKMDQIPQQDREAVLADFLERVRELGFAPDQGGFFAVSAKEAQSGSLDGSRSFSPDFPENQFERLRGALFSHRAREQIQALRVEDAFNQIRYALGGSARRELEALHQALLSQERELTGRVREVFVQAMSSAQSRDVLRRIIREQAWREAPGRVGGFLALPVWMRARLAFSWLAYHLARMSTGGPSLTRMLRAGWHAAKAAWQGILPMQTLLGGFSADQERRLREVSREARRVLEDMGLDRLSDTESSSFEQQPFSGGQEGADQALWAARIVNILRSQGILPKTADKGQAEAEQRTRLLFQERLEQAVLSSASRMAHDRLGLVHTVAGNLLPVLVFGHGAYRLVSGWLAGSWLPFDFYLTAAAVFLISLVPGYLLVSVALARAGSMPAPEQLVQALEAPAETEPLRRVRERLGRVLDQVQGLEDALRVGTEVLHHELDPASFGMTVRQQGGSDH